VLHHEWDECAICQSTGWDDCDGQREWVGLSLHHVCKHPRDDVRGNLVLLCGDGVRGCHGRIEAWDAVTLRLLGEHILEERPDTIAHLEWRFGEEGAQAWLQRHLKLDS
jgi:hypothetical protein